MTPPSPPPQPPPQPIVGTPAPVRVQVIVELKLAPGLPHTAAIARAQDEVLATLPPGGASVTQRYATLPMLALELDPALVDTLKRNPRVIRVSPDEKQQLLSK